MKTGNIQIEIENYYQKEIISFPPPVGRNKKSPSKPGSEGLLNFFQEMLI